MTDINTVVLIGNLTRDMDLSYFQSGSAFGKLSIAVNRSFVKQGSKVDEVSYFDVTLFGKMAEGLKQYLTKGKKIAITGSLKQERWNDSNGNARSKVSILADSVQLLGGNKTPEKVNQIADTFGGEVQQEFKEDIPF